MVANQKNQFVRTYESALAAHLARGPRPAKTSRSARAIGKQAVQLGLTAIDLARVHDLAMTRLEGEKTAPKGKRLEASGISSSAVFQMEALAPLERERIAQQLKSQRTEKSLEGRLRRESNRHEKLLQESQTQRLQVRRLTFQFLLAQETERKEISRDLHDEISQVLAGINVRLTTLKKVAQIGSRDISDRIDQTQKLVEQSVEAVHRYALRLRPSLLDDLGIVPSIRSYIKDLPGSLGLKIRFNADSSIDSFGNEQATALYRVAQEALTNVVRHAKAKNVWVDLSKTPDSIKLEIRDDGKSFNAKRILNSATPKRLGLLGMRERIEMLGGAFSIESKSPCGTTITAVLPFSPRGKGQP
ncbi:sensor histidine kinase [Pelagicoccus sp. SDUM812003]|uniref:sensor histidine kinase n=1 Tax=Pelagicoccus sp. SDUM812003 TaxID=3041267 RepID=UPI00280D794A|nr:sensor histidine kinase [Pelagicoccus sp. SDUM812003]MDQ8204316.1 sensor histidine kinase [Pelagicoccus sp. SDUM812003]